ncbi:alpha/beta hydrolase [Actinospica sp.]|uniref:alpha/beta hydrolase n=1 Tax=Actinospica sp. TaxID=1872142 RepID=UPI002BDCF4A7|nr:alpha/beta hydrolase-fold protein [Actinospica sp.]HWG25135.1 alpha/beta hydrolase-fold protein [Actinospica sp.]
MSPISGSLQITTVVLAVLAALATWLLWNRMRGPRAVRMLQRAALLVFGELMAAVAILVWVNISSGGLVVSWQDLLGNQSTRGGVFAGQQGAIQLDPKAQTVAVVRRQDVAVTARFVRATFHPSSEGFQETTFRGPVSGITSQVYVWTPPQYAAEPHTYFPVLELLHGVVGSPDGWMGPMNVVAHLEAAERSGKVLPYILVVPEVTPIAGHTWPFNNEECSDVPGDANVDTWLTRDVRTMVIDDLRAEPAADAWGLMGYSTGGFCAAKLVLQHPNRYRAAVSLSGYYLPDSQELSEDPVLDHENSPLWLISHTRTPAVSLLMTASAQDNVDPASEAAKMIAAAKANPQARATDVQSFVAPLGGGHNQSAWEKMLPTAFTWLSQRLAGPTP